MWLVRRKDGFSMSKVDPEDQSIPYICAWWFDHGNLQRALRELFWGNVELERSVLEQGKAMWRSVFFACREHTPLARLLAVYLQEHPSLECSLIKEFESCALSFVCGSCADCSLKSCTDVDSHYRSVRRYIGDYPLCAQNHIRDIIRAHTLKRSRLAKC